MTHSVHTAIVVTASFAWLAGPSLAGEPAPSFTRDIKGILSNRCEIGRAHV